MSPEEIQAIVTAVDAQEAKRSKYKTIGIICGLAAVFPVWVGIFGSFFFFAWMAALIAGFALRGAAVTARDEAMRLRIQIMNIPGSPYSSQNLTGKAAYQYAMQTALSTGAQNWTIDDGAAPTVDSPSVVIDTPAAIAAPAAMPQPTGTTESRLNKARKRG